MNIELRDEPETKALFVSQALEEINWELQSFSHRRLRKETGS
jgi:hypothetical protein